MLPDGGELNVEVEDMKVGAGDEPPEEVRRYLQGSDGITEVNRRDYGPVRIDERRKFSEGMIEPGEMVYVFGKAREVAD